EHAAVREQVKIIIPHLERTTVAHAELPARIAPAAVTARQDRNTLQSRRNERGGLALDHTGVGVERVLLVLGKLELQDLGLADGRSGIRHEQGEVMTARPRQDAQYPGQHE